MSKKLATQRWELEFRFPAPVEKPGMMMLHVYNASAGGLKDRVIFGTCWTSSLVELLNPRLRETTFTSKVR